MESKPFSYYHFRSQSIFTIDNEPLAVCVAGDKLLVATVGHCVEVRNLDDHGRHSHTFCTVDLVKQILHSEIGQYVATLEVKASRQTLMTHVRLYFNWHVDMKGLPMRARIAGRVTPSSQSGVGHLEMVELPLQKQACYINYCKSTGNLAVSCGFSVSIFYFCVKIHDISKLQFHDLEHIMEVYYTFPIKEVALCEDFLACMSANEVHVVKINFRSTIAAIKSPVARSASSRSSPKQDIPRSRSSFEIGRRSSVPDSFSIVKDDPYFISWKGSAASRRQSWTLSPEEEAMINDWKKKLNPDSWPLTIHLPSLLQQAVYVDQSNFPREEIGPMDFFPGQPVKLEYTGALDHGYDGMCHQFDITSMLYRRFPVPPSNCLDHQFCLHSLQFLPLYISEPVIDSEFKDPLRGAVLRTSLSNTGNPLHSLRHHLLKHLEVFFSSPTGGFLYNLHGEVYAVASYPYRTTSVCHVALENNILHAVSTLGIETYSLGCWDRILKHFQCISLAEKMRWHSMKQCSFLLGMHPFLSIQLMTFENGNLLMLANANDGSSSFSENITWTVYALQCPLAEEFYRDMLDVFGVEEPRDEHLDQCGDDEKLWSMHSAHAVLATEVLLNQPPVTSRLSQLFQEACCQLADLYFTSEMSNISAALGFYIMSGCSLESILRKMLLTELKFPLKKIYDFLSLIFIENRYNKCEELSKDVADAVVNVFFKVEPKNLSLLFLSGYLSGYDSAVALEHIQKMIATQKRVEDVVTVCILCTHIGMVDSIPSHLSSVTNDTLLNLTTKYPNVWLTVKDDGDTTFSSFLQVVQQLNPNVFSKIMQQLFVVGRLSPNIISLLCQSDWEDFGLAMRTDVVFMQFLEELLINKCVRPWHCSEAVLSLIMLYLKCLRSAELKNILPLQSKPWNIFGFRRPWLNELPPFLGHSIHGPCKVMLESADSGQSQFEEANEENKEECPCSTCNDCLLRLQSLLCSDLCGSEARAKVLLEVTTTPTLKGALSLKVLASPSLSEAANVLLSHFPSALLEYCQDTFGNDSIQWQKLLNILLLKVEQESLAVDEKQSLDASINGVVSYLAEIVSPTELVIMLPQQQNARFFPQVKRCIAKHQAKNLHDIIVAKGYELKSLV